MRKIAIWLKVIRTPVGDITHFGSSQFLLHWILISKLWNTAVEQKFNRRQVLDLNLFCKNFDLTGDEPVVLTRPSRDFAFDKMPYMARCLHTKGLPQIADQWY